VAQGSLPTDFSWSLVAPRLGVWSRDSRLCTGVWSHTLIIFSNILQIAFATRLHLAVVDLFSHERGHG
jgi:hypothetical protein